MRKTITAIVATASIAAAVILTPKLRKRDVSAAGWGLASPLGSIGGALASRSYGYSYPSYGYGYPAYGYAPYAYAPSYSGGYYGPRRYYARRYYRY